MPIPLLADANSKSTTTDKTHHSVLMRPYLKLRNRWKEQSCWKMAVAGSLLAVILFVLRLWLSGSAVAEDPAIAQRIASQPSTIGTIKVKLDVYMESLCPDTTAFIEEQLWPVWQEMGDFIDLHIIPFGKADWHDAMGGDFTFTCQHGQRECDGNQLMCCGIERLREPRRYLPYIRCLQGKDVEDTAECNRAARLSQRQMLTCAKGRQGRVLHHQMGQETKRLSPPLHFVPWVIIEGRRSPKAHRGLKAQLCLALKDKRVNLSFCSEPI